MCVLCFEFRSSTVGFFPTCYKVIILGYFRYGSEGNGIMSLELVHLLNFAEIQWMPLGLDREVGHSCAS